ncbi:hypothetical protein GGI35DRAFT_453182 [Trichoderma velutinum]
MNRDSLRFSWRLTLLCGLVAIIASPMLTKNLLIRYFSPGSTEPEQEPESPLPVYKASVVTRPNPEVVGFNKDEMANSSARFLQSASKSWTYIPDEDPTWAEETETNKPMGPESRVVLHHSFGDINRDNRLGVVPYGNGFVDGIIRAFQQDLHLVLRPDDIWLAITVQLSFYINAHAEELRSFFVEHEGKKQLVVDLSPQTMINLDIAYAAKLFTGLIQENVRDPDLKSWLLPDFSTTTDNDISVAAMVMMATTKSYFEYILLCGCGFPSVTLVGERDDWVKLLERLPKLATFGHEPAEWSKLLVKVVEKMIETFDRPDEEATKDFWMKVVHRAGSEGSGGLDTLSGWITAFCFWDNEGKRIRQYADEDMKSFYWDGMEHEDRKRLFIDDVEFPIIRTKTVPQAVVEVPVKVLDSSTMLEYETTIIAGSVGMTATASENKGEFNTFQPRSGWWMLLDKVKSIDEQELDKYVDIVREQVSVP